MNHCIFGCPKDMPDSIEHYAKCPCVASVTGVDLGLPRVVGEAALMDFLALDLPSSQYDVRVVLKAIRMAAVYRTHVQVTHGAMRVGAAAKEALRQALREVVRGHAGASRAYDNAQARYALTARRAA